MLRNANSFRMRLTLLHFGVIVVVVAIAAVVGQWVLSNAVHGQLDAALLALAETEAATLTSERDRPIRVHEVAPGPAPPSFVRLDRLVQIVDANGSVLARSANLGGANLPVSPQLASQLSSGEVTFKTLPGFGEEPTRMVTVPVNVNGEHFAVQVAGSLDDVNNVVASAGILFTTLAIALLAAVGSVGALLVGRVFRAVDDVVQKVRRIGEGNLSDRLPHPGTRDEIGRLVDTLNDMLARLEQSFESQRHFTADASHELRSPLSRLRAELEVTLRRPRETTEYVDTLRSCLDEVERLTQLVDELLTLARLDASQERVPVEPVVLNTIAEDAIRRLEPVARARQIKLVFNPSPVVSARVTRSHMDLVLANLLDNAVKFSPLGGTVTLSLDSDNSDAVVNVSDAGSGIDADELPRIFERFYRGANARSSEIPGAGLGLAVSQAIVRAYRGQIDASKVSGGGARFTVRLPLSPTESVPNGRLQRMPNEDHAKDEGYSQRETHAEGYSSESAD